MLMSLLQHLLIDLDSNLLELLLLIDRTESFDRDAIRQTRLSLASHMQTVGIRCCSRSVGRREVEFLAAYPSH